MLSTACSAGSVVRACFSSRLSCTSKACANHPYTRNIPTGCGKMLLKSGASTAPASTPSAPSTPAHMHRQRHRQRHPQLWGHPTPPWSKDRVHLTRGVRSFPPSRVLWGEGGALLHLPIPLADDKRGIWGRCRRSYHETKRRTLAPVARCFQIPRLLVSLGALYIKRVWRGSLRVAVRRGHSCRGSECWAAGKVEAPYLDWARAICSQESPNFSLPVLPPTVRNTEQAATASSRPVGQVGGTEAFPTSPRLLRGRCSQGHISGTICQLSVRRKQE